MKILRWILVLPSAYLAWWIALIVGITYIAVLDRFCPPESVVSGLCTASWYDPALNAGIIGGACLAAALVMIAVTLVAPSHRRFVAIGTLVVGGAAALYMAYVSELWQPGLAAILVGTLVLLFTRKLHR